MVEVKIFKRRKAMKKGYFILTLMLTVLLTLSFSVLAQTTQKMRRTTPAPKPGDLGPPKVVSFKINNGAATTTSINVILNNVTERATLFCASERPDLHGAYWKRMHSAPQFTLRSGDGVKTVYFQVANAQGRKSPIVSDTINLSTLPTVTSFKVSSSGVSWNYTSKTSFLYFHTSNEATNNPTQCRLSCKSDFSGAKWFVYRNNASVSCGKGIGRKTVYFQVRNNYGMSKVRSATFDVPSRRESTIWAAKIKKYSQPLGFNFSITPKDITSRCKMNAYQSISLVSPSGLTGSKCDYSLFSGRLLNQGWNFKSFRAIAHCESPDRGYSITESPNPGSRQIRFKVHLWTHSGKKCSWTLQDITLEGPGDAYWYEAFK
jgi:hypothetical protein